MGKVKQTEIKNQTYFYNDKNNPKDFATNLLKIEKKFYKGINIYYIGYSQLKKMIIVIYLQCKSFAFVY